MVDPGKIADVMGGSPVFHRPVKSLADLIAMVERGVPKSALRSVARALADDAAGQRRVMFRVVPEATYKRRRERLTRVESERTERLARVVATASHVWDDSAEARHFLNTPHPELMGKSPFESAFSELGARQVEELLARIEHGLPA
jgi:putative toxin-antitoxin system antitoxin component (TIGR02293 family)